MKKKIFLMLTVVAILVMALAISVNAEETDPYASYYDKSYVALDGTSLALYEKEGDTYYALAWFYDSANKKYESYRIGSEVTICPDGSTTPLKGGADFRENADFIFADGTSAYTMENLILVNLQQSPINMFSGSWSKLPIEAIYCNIDFRYVNGGAFNNAASLCVFDIPRAHSAPNATICSAFVNCLNLKEIYIPKTVCLITGALEKSGLERVEFAPDYAPVGYIGWQTTAGKSSWFNACKSLKTVILPSNSSTMTYIGDNTFMDCTALEEIVIPSYVTSIGSNAFRRSGIKSIVLPAGITSIGNYAFHSAKVTSVSFAPDFAGSLALGTGAFQNATSLTSISLPEGTTSISQECFTGCPITSFVLPDSVTSIGGTAFGNCKSLSTFTINPTSNLESIGSQAFKNTAITSFYFPNSLTTIGNHAFAYNEKNALVELVNFENCGVTSIPNGLFRQCGGLKTIKFPYGTTTINGSELFTYCNVETIILPKTLTAITNKIEASSIGKIIFAAPEGTELPANAPDNVEIEYDNYCKLYFNGAHIEGDNPCVIKCDRCGTVTAKENPNHSIEVTVTYESFILPGVKVVDCTNDGCTHHEEIKLNPLFVCNGYSSPEFNANGIVIGFTVDINAVKEYEAATGADIGYGVFAVSKDNLVENDICKNVFDENGKTADGAIVAEITTNFVAFELKVTGFAQNQMDIKLALGAYVSEKKDGATVYSYIQDNSKGENVGSYYFVSFNDIIQ